MRQKTRESREKDRGVKEMRTERERMRGGKWMKLKYIWKRSDKERKRDSKTYRGRDRESKGREGIGVESMRVGRGLV